MEQKRSFQLVRWIARVWSLVPIWFGLMHVFSPDNDPNIVVPWTDWLALSLAAVCLAGLAIAWRWERVGAWIALSALAVFSTVFLITVERIFPAIVIFLFVLGVPAVMFLVASGGNKPEPSLASK
jgi:hypothetical protein